MFQITISSLTAFSFLFYGFNCLLSKKMVAEFERYGLSPFQRKMTGALQLLGSIGILVGLYNPFIGFIAALGLSILMLLGFITRVKIKDSLVESLPSFIFIWVNAYIAFYFYHEMNLGV